MPFFTHWDFTTGTQQCTVKAHTFVQRYPTVIGRADWYINLPVFSVTQAWAETALEILPCLQNTGLLSSKAQPCIVSPVGTLRQDFNLRGKSPTNLMHVGVIPFRIGYSLRPHLHFAFAVNKWHPPDLPRDHVDNSLSELWKLERLGKQTSELPLPCSHHSRRLTIRHDGQASSNLTAPAWCPVCGSGQCLNLLCQPCELLQQCECSDHL